MMESLSYIVCSFSHQTATYLKQCKHSNYGVENIPMYIMSQFQDKLNTLILLGVRQVHQGSLQHVQFQQCSRISIYRMEQLPLASYTMQSMYIIETRRGRKRTLRDTQHYSCALICTQTALKLHLPQLQNECLAHSPLPCTKTYQYSTTRAGSSSLSACIMRIEYWSTHTRETASTVAHVLTCRLTNYRTSYIRE